MRKMILGILLLILVISVSGVMAIQKPAPGASASTASEKSVVEKVEKFSGVIEKVVQKGRIIKVKGKLLEEEKVLSFGVDRETKITRGKTVLTPKDLKKGLQVSIEYKRQVDIMIAVKIDIITQ